MSFGLRSLSGLRVFGRGSRKGRSMGLRFVGGGMLMRGLLS